LILYNSDDSTYREVELIELGPYTTQRREPMERRNGNISNDSHCHE
jgi:hypothetical protein